MVQLHGDEGPSFCAEVARRTGARVIKAAQVAGSGDVRDLERFHVDFHLLDARAKAVARQGMRGGTGETFDWELVRRAALEGAADPQRRTHAGERRRGDRDRRTRMPSTPPAAPSPRRGTRTLSGCARSSLQLHRRRRERAAGDDRSAGVSAERRGAGRRASLRPLRRAVRAGDADAGAGGARAGMAAGARATPPTARSSMGCCATSADARRRCTARDGSPSGSGGPCTSSARTSTTPARTSSTTRSARRCWPSAWASGGSSPRPAPASTASRRRRCARCSDLECVVYMGVEDTRRQRPNVQRMELLGATVQPVDAGARTLKEATSAAIRDWVTNVREHALRDRLGRSDRRHTRRSCAICSA